MPASSLNDLLTRENIEAELRQEHVTSTPELTDFIYENAKKAFAILVYTRSTSSITGFFEYRFTDAYLPIQFVRGDDYLEVETLSRSPPANLDALDVFTATTGSDGWCLGDNRLHDFCERQWQFIAPVFLKDQYLYNFHEKTILPFNFKGEEKSGGFSKVYQIRIHPAHLQMPSPV